MDKRFSQLITVVLAIAVLGTLSMQIARANESTSTETALFSVLQFIFSVAFAWLLARTSFRSEFLENQRNFAIAAFRRIKSIERAVTRLLSHSAMTEEDVRENPRMTALREIGLGLRDSIDASIADWADVIGDEIEIVQELESLRSRRLREDFETGEPDEEQFDSRFEELLEQLPSSLRVASRGSSNRNLAEVAKSCEEEMEKYGAIRFHVYVDDDFDVEAQHVLAGEELQVAIRDGNHNRTACLIAHRPSGEKVGVLENFSSGLDYGEFVEAFVRWYGRSEFPVRVLEGVLDDHHYAVETTTAPRGELEARSDE